MISVSLSAGGGTVAVAKRANGSSIDIEKVFAKMLGSLCPIATIARERWAEPGEGAFSFECPPGWAALLDVSPLACVAVADSSAADCWG